jgi:UDP-galactopyranose mutase
MKILVVGTGFSGATIARLLHESNHDVSIIEKEEYVGGLSITRVSPNGYKYEPFGARTFHTKKDEIRDFVLRFGEFNDYIHRKGMILNGELFPFPITRSAAGRLPEAEEIFKELDNRPDEVDKTNFETACKSIFSPILYRYFIENYTTKMWGMTPDKLTAEWAPKRLEFGKEDDDWLFKGQWQGLPKEGYSCLLEKIIKGIPITLNCTSYNTNEYDLVISTAQIDEVLDFKYGKLPYRSMKFEHFTDEEWEKDNYGTMNLPQHEKFIRKCNFKILHKQDLDKSTNWIQYQEPIPADENNLPMYPINTNENNDLFDKYLKDICKTNIFPAGRLGLFKYLDMDKAVEISFDLVDLIENYTELSPEQRYSKIKIIRGKY